ncbi:hypothetical protein [Pseudomonas fontis]|uniref:Lipoprotein n=1 Tax=Pseudomonas fontis TaxID=2942633 RepID=A0ABT5P1F0_9PSED|nr:hypothetical protein [Pseudomonas fontis]MDD0974117.1 hypothetical protein [Pseudomonas fontis]MDD0994187.1 hypothetical protein [Pseudomonas fontis]
MGKSPLWRIALLLAVALLSGCGPSYTYRYSPPPSAHGLNCIASCSQQRSHCGQLVRMQESSDRALYQANLNAYQFCQAGKSKKEARRSCYYPSYPYGGGSSFSCERDYDQCYQGCGGTIQRILNKD